MQTVLITGFEPFGGETLNPSWEVVKQLDGMIIDNCRVVARQLPCVFGESLEVLNAAIDALQPSVVLAIGQAGGRVDVTVERVAINVDDARIPDNRGQQPVDVAIVPDGPAAWFSTLPIKAMVEALREAGIISILTLGPDYELALKEDRTVIHARDEAWYFGVFIDARGQQPLKTKDLPFPVLRHQLESAGEDIPD
ncbi:MAG: pyroglutamyl-peptidase I, partial [Leclercia adecarboxylata]|nr:pyroglutamyl-peptidase I [Leclercia adecarboxylata]